MDRIYNFEWDPTKAQINSINIKSVLKKQRQYSMIPMLYQSMMRNIAMKKKDGLLWD